jgi:hypothetical protein
MDLSEAFSAEMRSFWGLDEAWEMPLKEETTTGGS